MIYLLSPARIVFGLCIAFFGLEYLLVGRFLGGLPPAPPWTPGAPALAYLLGAALALAGIALAARFRAFSAALSVAVIFLFCAVLLYGLHFHDILADGNVRTGAFEALSISGAAFVLASRVSAPNRLSRRLDLFGRILFAISMLVFGEQHFQYVAFVAPLIPGWIPAHVFFTYFTGIGFLAAALAIGFNVLRPLAAMLLGLMLLFWVLFLHTPRVLHAPKNRDELISLVVALVISAGSFAIAAPPEASHREA